MCLWMAGFALMVLGHQTHATAPAIPMEKPDGKAKKLSKVDVESVLAYLKKHSPQVHEDALRVWKDFKSGKSEPHYTYRFWARDMILWLRKNRGLCFETQEKVGEVFRLLHELGAISKDAAILLTTDVWSFLIYREGIPDMEQRMLSPQHSKPNNNHELDA
mgnify:CR=1 FL=1